MTEQKRELKSEAATTKDSVKPMGSTGVGMTLRSCPILKQEARPLNSTWTNHWMWAALFS